MFNVKAALRVIMWAKMEPEIQSALVRTDTKRLWRVENIKLAKTLKAYFLSPVSSAEERIATDIRAFHASQAKQRQAELFKQKKRLADSAFTAAHPHAGPVFGLGKVLGKTRLDKTREIRIPGRQGSDTVQMVR